MHLFHLLVTSLMTLCLIFSSVQSLSHIQLFLTPWTAARQTTLPITSSWSLLKLMSIESVMPSNHLILCLPLLLPPSIFASIRVYWSARMIFFPIESDHHWCNDIRTHTEINSKNKNQDLYVYVTIRYRVLAGSPLGLIWPILAYLS